MGICAVQMDLGVRQQVLRLGKDLLHLFQLLMKFNLRAGPNFHKRHRKKVMFPSDSDRMRRDVTGLRVVTT
jgi:hypothetical protein